MQLPANIHIATLQDTADQAGPGTLLLRLAHLFATGEDPQLSGPVTVDLSSLFTSIALSACQEMSLTANQKARPSVYCH